MGLTHNNPRDIFVGISISKKEAIRIVLFERNVPEVSFSTKSNLGLDFHARAFIGCEYLVATTTTTATSTGTATFFSSPQCQQLA